MLLDKVIKNRIEKTDTASPLVSLAKSISWRLLGTIDTILISWFITGETTVALSIGAVEVVTKMLLYYVHERLWERFFFKTRNQR